MRFIREARKTDLRRIAEVHVTAWHEAYLKLVPPLVLEKVTVESRLKAWDEWFELQDQQIHILLDENSILGFIRTSPAINREVPPENFAELTHLYLHPDQISKGVGHQLFIHAKSLLKDTGYRGLLLWTIEDNLRARHFYESHGMSADGTRDDQPEWLGEGVYEVRYVLPFDV